MKTFGRWLAVGGVGAALAASAGEEAAQAFRKIRITDKFWSEGVAIGDFNRDGAGDVCAGPCWYAGPAFTNRHDYRPATATFRLKRDDGTETVTEGFEGALGKANAYSDDFMNFAQDINRDGWMDIFAIGLPGTAATWYENPQGRAGHWPAHRVFGVVDNESPMLEDLVGDGQPELVCGTDGYLGYATPDAGDPAKPWVFHRISPKGKWHKYTHGLGAGDLNGDGRKDMVLADGWWEQPASLEGDPVWTSHPFTFAEGGAQMFVYDVNGDGLNDVLTCLNPHRYGVVWWEQQRIGDVTRFTQHTIVGSRPDERMRTVVFSQPHAQALIDVDRDGLPDLVTGKRFWAHGPTGDVEPNAPAVLYWCKLVRDPATKTAEFRPCLIDEDSGVGMQIAAGELGGDPQLIDLAVSNKKGTFVFLHERQK